MSTVPDVAADVTRVRRVRQEARDSVAVMAVSAGMSVGLATVLLLVASLAR